MTVKIDQSGIGSFRTSEHRSAWLTFACSILLASAFPTSLQAATYYWQDDSGTSVAGFTTDSPGCESEVDDGFQTTLMSAGGFNCNKFVNKVNLAAPHNIVLMIKDTVYAVATDVTGIDFFPDFPDAIENTMESSPPSLDWGLDHVLDPSFTGAPRTLCTVSEAELTQ